MKSVVQDREFVTGARSSPRSASLFLAMGFIFLGILILPVARAPIIADMVMAVIIGTVPLLYAIRQFQKKQFDFFEVILPVSVLYFVYFGWSTVYLKANPEAFDHQSLLPYLSPALLVATVGFLCMWCGYLVCFRRTRQARVTSLVPTGLSVSVLITLLGFFGHFSLYLQERYQHATGGFSGLFSLGQQFHPFFYFSWFLAWYQIFSKKLKPLQILFLMAVLVPVAAAVGYFTMGGKEMAIVIMGMPTIAYWYVRRRLPWKTILAVFLVAVFVVFPIYNTYRFQDRQASTAERLDRSLEIANRWDKGDYLDRSIYEFLHRVGMVTSVAAVLRDVPRYVDYKYGETIFMTPVALFIPRILWPDKPNMGLGREFGQTFQLVSAWDNETYAAPTLVGEFFWNFHIFGVMFGMFAFGAVLRFCHQKFNQSTGFDPIGKSLYMILFVRLIHFEGNVAFMFAGLTRILAIFYLVIFVARKLSLLQPGVDSSS